MAHGRRGDGATGILLANATTNASLVVDNTRIEYNATGIAANTFAGSVAIRNSLVSDSATHGVDLRTAAGQILTASIDNALLFRSAGNGLNVQGGDISIAMSSSTLSANGIGAFVQGCGNAATARLTNNVITRNATGIQTGANGSILTPLSNTIEGNGVDGAASSNYSPR